MERTQLIAWWNGYILQLTTQFFYSSQICAFGSQLSPSCTLLGLTTAECCRTYKELLAWCLDQKIRDPTLRPHSCNDNNREVVPELCEVAHFVFLPFLTVVWHIDAS